MACGATLVAVVDGVDERCFAARFLTCSLRRLESLTARQIRNMVLSTCSKSGDYAGTIVDSEGPSGSANSDSCNRNRDRNRQGSTTSVTQEDGLWILRVSKGTRYQEQETRRVGSSCNGTAEGHALRIMSLHISPESSREHKRCTTVRSQASVAGCDRSPRPVNCSCRASMATG